MGELKRVFLAVDVDAEVTAMLAQHLSRWELPGAVVPPSNWHLTLRFLGGVDEVHRELLAWRLAEAPLGGAFEVKLGALGAFPRPTRAGVLWLGLERGAEHLSRLHAAVEAKVVTVGIAPEGRPFTAHLTLSRLRPPEDVSALVAAYEAQPFRWKVEELILYESTGGTYVPLERFPL